MEDVYFIVRQRLQHVRSMNIMNVKNENFFVHDVINDNWKDFFIEAYIFEKIDFENLSIIFE